MNAYISAILPKKMRKWGSKRKKKNFLGTPTTPHFFGSLGIAEHGKNGEHALSVAKLFCRPNPYLIFYAIFSLHFKPLLPFSPGTSYII